MSIATKLSFRKSSLFMVAGIAIFILYLYFYIGPKQILLVLGQINSTQYVIFYSIALLATLCSVFFWSAAWNSILRNLSVHVSYRRAYLYYWVGYFTDLVIPCATVCGEATRLYLVQKETEQNYGAIAAAAVTNRIVAYIIVTFGLYAGAFLVTLKGGTPPLIGNIFLTFLVGVTGYLAVLLYLALDDSAAKNLTQVYIAIMKRLRPKTFQIKDVENVMQSLEQFYNGFKIFRERRRLLIRPLLLHLTSYLLGLSTYILVFYALGIPAANPEFYIVVFFIATAVQDAVASFSVGSLDILLSTVFIFYGINPALSGIAAAVVRSAGFWFPLIIGLLSVQILGARNILSSKPKETQKTAA